MNVIRETTGNIGWYQWRLPSNNRKHKTHNIKWNEELIIWFFAGIILGILKTETIFTRHQDNVTVELKPKTKYKYLADSSAPIKDIKLYSELLFSFTTEICEKSLSVQDLSFLTSENQDLSITSQIINTNVSGKFMKVDRNSNFNKATFKFLDIFDHEVTFLFAQLTCFIHSDKYKNM